MSGIFGQSAARLLRINSPFGSRISPLTGQRSFHNGIDVAVPQGSPVYPLGPGTVTKIENRTPTGYWFAVIDHGNGFASSYVHLSRVNVRPGQTVRAGRPIGLSGGARGVRGSGGSTGPHLHLVLRRRGADGRLHAIDPIPWIDWRPFTLARWVKGRGLVPYNS